MQLFVNDLTVMDFSYLCPRRGMVGESWIVDVVLRGDLNDESMIQDFALVKKQLKSLIDEYVDHKLLVPVEHAYTQIEHLPHSEQVNVSFLRPETRSIHLSCPAEAYAFVYADEVTMASVGSYLEDILATHLPENVKGIELQLRTEHIPTPFYHYTHGLKKHDGNCQRIAHGHRSKITIQHGKQASDIAQTYWAQRWADIYIGSREDQIPCAELAHQYADIADTTHYAFAYTSSQGYFELAIPIAETDIIDTDTTVECLAQHLLTQELVRSGQSDVTIIAYEGVGKGALVSSD
jgi:6-pyruvoyl-tetrahydropterin synthase